MKKEFPYWRTIYEDGCDRSQFECLNCEDVFNSNTSEEVSTWSFCPMCGIKWVGKFKGEVSK